VCENHERIGRNSPGHLPHPPVTPLINNLEAKTFKSESGCHAECDKTSGAVNKLFFRTLKATQKKENKQ